jgi:phytanoyl-CoA hydroxylase
MNRVAIKPGFYELSEKSKIIEEYEKNGFVVFRNVIDQELIAEANNHVKWLTQKYPDLRPEHFHHPLMRNDAFWVRLVTDEKLQNIAELFLGSNLACFTAHYICKPAFDGHAVLWHQDGAYWNLHPMEAATLWLAIDESNSSNGCLRMIPGSHKLPLQELVLRSDVPNMLFSSLDTAVVESWIENSGIVEVELQPGDVSVHHPHIIHGSEANTSPNRRCGLDIGFIQPSTQIRSQGLYIDPLFVKGSPIKGINNYRAYPEYITGESIEFQGFENWNRKVREINQSYGFVVNNSEDTLEITQRMMHRLQAGATKDGK